MSAEDFGDKQDCYRDASEQLREIMLADFRATHFCAAMNQSLELERAREEALVQALKDLPWCQCRKVEIQGGRITRAAFFDFANQIQACRKE